MIDVFIDALALEDCRARALEILKKKKFREIGGYLLGHFDGRTIRIRYFLLDDNSESTSTRIKLSNEAYEKVEFIQETFSCLGLVHLGDWHVHPGEEKPSYSSVDLTTLFLERFQINTDNPEEVNRPLIHIIFNNSLTEMSTFIMNIDMEISLISLLSAGFRDQFDVKNLENSLLLINDTLTLSKKTESASNYESIQSNLEGVMDYIEELLEQTHKILQCHEDLEWYQKNQTSLEKLVSDTLDNGVKMGIIIKGRKGTIQQQDYRPKNIQNSFDDDNLLGFWKFFPYETVDPSFHSIFLANFITHLEEEFVKARYFMVHKVSESIMITPYVVLMREPNKIQFEELLPQLW